MKPSFETVQRYLQQAYDGEERDKLLRELDRAKGDTEKISSLYDRIRAKRGVTGYQHKGSGTLDDTL